MVAVSADFFTQARCHTTLAYTCKFSQIVDSGEEWKSNICRYRFSRNIADYPIQALCNVSNVLGVQTSHGDTAVSGHINVGLLSQLLSLRGRKASEAKVQGFSDDPQ